MHKEVEKRSQVPGGMLSLITGCALRAKAYFICHFLISFLFNLPDKADQQERIFLHITR